MMRFKSMAFMAGLAFSLTSCGSKSHSSSSPAPSAAGQVIVPQDATLQTISFDSTDGHVGQKTNYALDFSTNILTGTWDKTITRDGKDVVGEAKSTITVSAADALTLKFQLTIITAEARPAGTCGVSADGGTELGTVTYLDAVQKSTSTTISGVGMFASVCADFYLKDDVFNLAVSTIKQKLPQPTDDSAYSPVQ